MSIFQIEVTLSAHGYINVSAADAEDAKKKLRSMEPRVRWRGVEFSVDTSLCDEDLEMRIERVSVDDGEPA